MLRLSRTILVQATRSSSANVSSLNKSFAIRGFSEKLSIPSDKEQQVGRRKEEVNNFIDEQ
jgi:hypothetical protein